MLIQHYFSENYAQARDKFVAACRIEGADVERFVNPASGPDNIELSTEVAWFGPRSASRLLVLVSGAHGVEALPGSACQTGMIASGKMRDLPPDTAVLMIHVINCYGAAHQRRNTDGNVDLCRNFLDFKQPLPTRPSYEYLHDALACPDADGSRREAATAVLADFARRFGPDAYIEALMGGQYCHADGFSFGGTEPSWSNQTLCTILERYTRNAQQVAFIDYHTGLGPFAYGMAVTMHTGTDLARARRWFGEWIVAPNLLSADAPTKGHLVFGHTTDAYLRALPQAQVTSVVLEFGTYPAPQTLPTMLLDHWLVHHGDPQSAQGRQIKEQLLRFHYPLDPEWRQAVWDRSTQVVGQALRGLGTAV